MVNIWPDISHITGDSCALCHAPADGLCAPCSDRLPRNTTHCVHCALPLPAPTPPGTLCTDCQRHPPAFDRVVAPLRYAPPVDDLVSAFKYRGRLAHGRLLADLLAAAAAGRGTSLPALLLPVPMHPRGLRERGFNQAGELTRRVAARLDLPWSAAILRRVRLADHQRGLGRAARRRNLREAFRCDHALHGHVALVDDVMTTGATADEVSRVLRAAGADWVEVWTVARTPRD